MKVGVYELVNEEKVRRALKGTLNSRGEYVGGIEKEDGSFDEDVLLAVYDRLGGLIELDKNKVQIGSFYDFVSKKPRVKPEVMLEFRVNGEKVAVSAEKELPPIVKATKLVEDNKKAKKEAKAKK